MCVLCTVHLFCKVFTCSHAIYIFHMNAELVFRIAVALRPTKIIHPSKSKQNHKIERGEEGEGEEEAQKNNK